MRALALFLLAAPAWAETPQQTTATYDNWTVVCQGPACEAVTRLNVKGQDGQLRPLLSMSFASGQSLRLQLPLGVDLTAAPEVRTDPPTALRWKTCVAAGCLAEAVLEPATVKQMTAKLEEVVVRFVALGPEAGKTIEVPVSLKGFGDAVKSLK
ncbi:invasion associated locus B family protein [Stagnihabitans tardus]|uniref:Invasion associated locus B family protein n=1 Tax=Stagnihabitans tardus TaxID=2699202 RepID=A0AAE4YAW1_9RHOB|nr:invasion associated locus B family protein [Stagnihabitans tardus]NBZ86250.1 hypothetical protein [Stagnihabitans tardus]